MRPNNPQSAGSNPQSIELHIEELVLRGFAPGDRYPIGDAVEHELTRLFAEHGVPPSLIVNIESEHIDAGDFHVAPESKAQTVGAQVAQAVYGGLTR